MKEKYTEDIKKEIVAFANSEGGTIYIGVQDDRTILGVENIDSISLQILNSCRDSIKPDIMMLIKLEVLPIDSKKSSLFRDKKEHLDHITYQIKD